jgi:hypothetical protein
LGRVSGVLSVFIISHKPGRSVVYEMVADPAEAFARYLSLAMGGASQLVMYEANEIARGNGYGT